MFSIVVCGRNDNYGINLHKRTAISLNQLASLCRDETDEVIYVDCNTPEHTATLTEEIADTLSDEALRRTRTIRISGQQMRKAIGDTPLPFSDELSRNVGFRRSNPANRWILSTNCDVLIQSIGTKSFHEILSELRPGFYLCPRLSISPDLWQMLDRSNVSQILELCEQLASAPVRFPPDRPETWLRFSSVGDFQLAPREQWFRIKGCQESMKLWGHSDANNALRLSILNRVATTPDLGNTLRVYHLDHRPAGALSQGNWPQNDWKKWISDVADFEAEQQEDWGLNGIDLPEIQPTASFSANQILSARRKRRSHTRAVINMINNRLFRFASRWLDGTKK